MIAAAQVRMARAGLGLALEDLADRAGLPPAVVAGIEASGPADTAALGALERVLAAAGATFETDATGALTVRIPPGPQAGAAGYLRPQDLDASNDG